MLEIEQAPLFDYASLDTDTRVFVQEKAQAIHARLKRTAEDIIAIGQDLIEVKARLRYGEFVSWLRSEFDMNLRSAQRFMSVATRFASRNDNLSFLPISVLYELAAPSTPDTVIDMVESGDIPATIPAIRAARQQPPVPGDFFEQWQADNRSLGLDTYADGPLVLPESWKLPPEMRGEPAETLTSKERRDTHVMRVMGSSESPEWYTPRHIVEAVCLFLGEIDIDPCSNSHEAPNVPARTIYTREDDGLSQDWQGKVYLNPPYGSEISQWTDKLVESYGRGVDEALALVPGRIDTAWFQPFYAHVMCHIRGRLQFSNAVYSAPFPSILVYLGPRIDDFIQHFQHLGPIMRRVG